MAEDEQTGENPENKDQKDNKGIWLAGAIVVILVVIAAVVFLNQNRQQTTETTSPSPAEIESTTEATGQDSSITVSNQSAGNTVIIPTATLIAPGYIVIHEQEAGELGPAIGASELYEAGTYQDIEVTLDRASVSTETLYGMLHDDDGNAQYEFPGPDAPTVNSLGEIVVSPFKIL